MGFLTFEKLPFKILNFGEKNLWETYGCIYILHSFSRKLNCLLNEKCESTVHFPSTYAILHFDRETIILNINQKNSNIKS